MRRRAIGFSGFLVFATLAGLSACGSSGPAAVNPADGAAGSSGEVGTLGPCGVTEAEPNDTRTTATPYTAGAVVPGCVGSETDVDLYQFTAPADDAAGGYYQVSLDDVGDGFIDAKIYTAADNGSVNDVYKVDAGASVRLFFAAAPGQIYRVAVSNFSAFAKPFRYSFAAKYTKVADAYEPNDTRAMAKQITVGTPITAHLFTGYRAATIDNKEFLDYYAVTLAAGMATIKITTFPADALPDLTLYDPDGVEIDRQYSLTAGANVTIMKDVTAGSYFISVGPFSTAPTTTDEGIALPDSFTLPYTLAVTQ
ncbi:MAG TPA: hypothetical protein VFH73_14875 [Polyangia bacterium]|nr:hypothetical protein [Polyangia bacterium]